MKILVMRKDKDAMTAASYDHVAEILVTALVSIDKISASVRIVDGDYAVQVEES